MCNIKFYSKLFFSCNWRCFVFLFFSFLVMSQVIEEDAKYWEAISSALAVGWLDIAVCSFIQIIYKCFPATVKITKKQCVVSGIWLIFTVNTIRWKCCACMDLINLISLGAVRFVCNSASSLNMRHMNYSSSKFSPFKTWLSYNSLILC